MAIIDIQPQKTQAQFLSSPADIAICGGSAGGGKLLDIDTELPSPSGWVRLGDVQDGDWLFDEQGKPCRVVKAHAITLPDRAYRMRFDDGTTILAGGEHLWLTYTADDLIKLTRRNPDVMARRRIKRPSRSKDQNDHKAQLIAERNRRLAEQKRDQLLLPPTGSIKSTDAIAATVLDRRGRRNHAIPVSAPWQLPEADLPLDPYLLGIWLGDGTTTAGSITTADDEIVQAFQAEGFTVKKWQDRYTWGVNGLRQRLRQIGVFCDKHIPLIYRRASYAQRLALLQGLMDTDGYAKPNRSTVEFYSTRAVLAEHAFELVISLGGKATLRSKPAMLDGQHCGIVYVVSFSTDLPVFRLARKLALRCSARRSTRFRYLVSCDRVAPVPMRCLTVDSPSRLYLCGRSAIPTHNTYALLLEPLRHVHNPRFSAIFFRRESKQIHLPGGLFDTAMEIYPGVGAKHRLQPMLEFSFRSGAKIVMTHLNLESDVAAYQGSQIPLLVWDELTHFSKYQFFYLLSRNRSTCGVKPYVRASCNPDPDSWVADFISWWIDQDTGYAIKERSGQLRYFVTVPTEADTVQVWGNDPHEATQEATGISRPSEAELRQTEQLIDSLIAQGEDTPVDTEVIHYVKTLRSAKSVTFIRSSVYDNPALLMKDQSYIANLKSQSRVERARLLDGNWKIRPMAGLYFAKMDARIVPELPDDIIRWVRSWDLAATEPNESNRNPDWTVGMKMGRRRNGRVIITDVRRVRRNAAYVRSLVQQTAQEDGLDCWIQLPQDPGQAGRDQSDSYRDMLIGYSVFSRTITRNKVTLAEPAAAAWQRGSIELLLGDWNAEVLSELDQFPDPKVHDDCADALSGGYNLLPSAHIPDYQQGGLNRRYRDTRGVVS